MHDIWNPWHGCKKISEGCDNCYMYYLDNVRTQKDSSVIYKSKTNFNYPLKKDRNGRVTLIDPENVFGDEDAFIAVKSDDLITIQLLINAIMKNDFKSWKELGSIPETEPIKSLFVRLGYSKEDIANMLKEF